METTENGKAGRQWGLILFLETKLGQIAKIFNAGIALGTVSIQLYSSDLMGFYIFLVLFLLWSLKSAYHVKQAVCK